MNKFLLCSLLACQEDKTRTWIRISKTWTWKSKKWSKIRRSYRRKMKKSSISFNGSSRRNNRSRLTTAKSTSKKTCTRPSTHTTLFSTWLRCSYQNYRCKECSVPPHDWYPRVRRARQEVEATPCRKEFEQSVPDFIFDSILDIIYWQVHQRYLTGILVPSICHNL